METTTVNYPESIARFYDVIYHNLRDSVDSDYFQSEGLDSKGKVLEVGVGTGRLFQNSLNKGIDVYGIDVSESMLRILRKKIPVEQQYRISNQNIIDFSFDFKFDLIIAPFRVIMHVLNKEDQLKALNNIYDHLNNNGRFIFDTFIPDLKQLLNGIKDQVDFNGEYENGHMLKRSASTQPDLINQIINVSFHLEWDENNKLRSDDWSFQMRYFFRFELEHLIERSKFEDYKIYGDYKNSELSNASKEFVMVCQKKQ